MSRPSMERQQTGASRQTDLFDYLDESREQEASGHGAVGDGGTGASAPEEQQVPAAASQGRALATNLIEQIADHGNLREAMRAVRRNKGAAGVDGMSIDELTDWFYKHSESLAASLLDGRFRPKPVRGVQIPKPGGGMRQLGVPTVVDRLVQTAILQVLEPLLDPGFSEFSFGFRPRRGAQQALRQAQTYVRDEGRTVVVDIDLEKFFDRVNHDILMARLARRIGDKRLLRLIRRFLEAGMMQSGVCVRSDEGTPQGGPLSPLLANVLLDDLDKELERRGHRFCRYADDCNIYVQSQAAGERVMASVSRFLEEKLKLKVNREKSAVADVGTRKFLGFRLEPDGRLRVAETSWKRLKQKIRRITRRSRGVKMEQVIKELGDYTKGWLAYFFRAECRTELGQMDGRIRRRLRCFRLKQLGGGRPLRRYLEARGVSRADASRVACSGKGLWRLSRTAAVHRAMTNARIVRAGLISLLDWYKLLKDRETAGCDIARPVV